MTFSIEILPGRVTKHEYGAWIGSCPRCGKYWVGMSQFEVFVPTDHHMRTESHFVCVGCRELQSECACS